MRGKIIKIPPAGDADYSNVLIGIDQSERFEKIPLDVLSFRYSIGDVVELFKSENNDFVVNKMSPFEYPMGPCGI